MRTSPDDRRDVILARSANPVKARAAAYQAQLLKDGHRRILFSEGKGVRAQPTAHLTPAEASKQHWDTLSDRQVLPSG